MRIICHISPGRWPGLGKRMALWAETQRLGRNATLGPKRNTWAETQRLGRNVTLAAKRISWAKRNSGMKLEMTQILVFRAEGPSICLAQANGLGIAHTRLRQGQRPDSLRYRIISLAFSSSNTALTHSSTLNSPVSNTKSGSSGGS